jgi:hypothetical protein
VIYNAQGFWLFVCRQPMDKTESFLKDSLSKWDQIIEIFISRAIYKSQLAGFTVNYHVVIILSLVMKLNIYHVY